MTTKGEWEENNMKDNPHPLADMICQWARTGQPVWFKDKENGKVTGPVTKGIDWDELDFYEYSFTPFED